MLKQRVITSLILAPLMTWGILALPEDWFALLFGLLVLAGFWEWAAFVTSKTAGRLLYFVVGGGVMALLHFYANSDIWEKMPWLGIVWLIIASLLIIRYPRISPIWQQSSLLKALVGLSLLVPTWVSVVALRQNIGAEFVLLLVLMIWGADIGAYFAGHKWGRVKLAPAVSPGKSWEGVIGGVLSTVAVALLSSMFLELPLNIMLFGFVALVVAAVSVLGDLNESLFKRITGIKDSGHILPGHGGILDRMDSLTTAAPTFYLAVTYLA